MQASRIPAWRKSDETANRNSAAQHWDNAVENDRKETLKMDTPAVEGHLELEENVLPVALLEEADEFVDEAIRVGADCSREWMNAKGAA